jgi:choline dehydrogenase
MQEETSEPPKDDIPGAEFAARVETNQRELIAGLRKSYDFIVCGSGSSGSVVARRLAENPAVSVLLLEAGGTDELPEITDATRWRDNLGAAHDWAFATRPNPHLNGRSLMWSMGKVLGGSSSINAMMWARGHKSDWDHFAAESGDDGWSYRSVLEIYRRIEDWRGKPDPERRGRGGLVVVEQATAEPVVTAACEAATSFGIPFVADQNGELMETKGGVALCNVRRRDGRRLSVFRSYAYPYMDRSNLTVLTHALVTRIRFKGTKAAGVDVIHDGIARSFEAGHELILSMGAIHTPKVLMQSGIGDAPALRSFGIDVVQHLPGVGCNLQEHLLLGGCMWEHVGQQPEQIRSSATLFWKSNSTLDTPDLQCMIVSAPFLSSDVVCPDTTGACWTINPGVVRPRSKGQIRLTGPDPMDPLDIDTNLLSDPADLRAAVRAVEFCREIGNATARSFGAMREVLPGRLDQSSLENFVRSAVMPFWHFTCTAKMGRDEMSVVDASLRVHGIDGLRIADGSIMPRVTTGNTMAPCVVIGERAAAMIRVDHGL